MSCSVSPVVSVVVSISWFSLERLLWLIGGLGNESNLRSDETGLSVVVVWSPIRAPSVGST